MLSGLGGLESVRQQWKRSGSDWLTRHNSVLSQSPSPSIARIAEVARALRELSQEVVFIGGAIAPLLQTHPTIQRVRATKDVDALLASTHYTKYHAMQNRLRELGFRVDMSDAKHAHRWRSPGEVRHSILYLPESISVELATNGTGSLWKRQLKPRSSQGCESYTQAPLGFLALKWAAFWDRGAGDPFQATTLKTSSR